MNSSTFVTSSGTKHEMLTLMDQKEKGCSAFPFSKAFLKMAILVLGTLLGRESAAQGWQLSFGGRSYDEATSLAPAIDGGFLFAGFSESFGADGDLDVYVVRTDIDGKVLWQQVYDLGFVEHGFDVLAETDGSFTLVGDVSLSPQSPLNVLLLRISPKGELLWWRRYDSASREVGKALCRTNDGGFLIAGSSTQMDDSAKDDFLLIKVDSQGNLQWRKTLGTAGDDIAEAVVTTRDGFVIAGNSDNPKGIDSDIVLYKVDENGEKAWPQEVRISTNEPDAVKDLIVARDGDLVIAGSRGFSSEAYLVRMAPDGTIRWEKTIGDRLGDVANSVIELPDGELVIAGQSEISESNPDLLIAGFDRNGQEKWRSLIGEEGVSEEGRQILPSIDGKFVVAGLKDDFAAQLNDAILIKTDARGNTISNVVAGRVYRDADGRCNAFDQARDTPLKNWLVRVGNGRRTYYGTTDATGSFEIRVDTGAYSVNVIPVNTYWKSCVADGFQVEITEFYDTTRVSFPIQAQTLCPYLEVDVATPFLAPCSEVVYTVDYCNIGTATAAGAYVEVTLSDELTFQSASLPLAGQNGNVYRFDLGNLASNDCGSFNIVSSLACSGIAQGQAGLVSAHIYPDTLCVEPDPNWDRASIIVSAICDPSKEESPIQFRIANVGKGNMSRPRRAIVTQDDIVWAIKPRIDYNLPAGKDTLISITDETNPGATYRIIAEQSEFHPGRSLLTAFVEGCVEAGQPFTTGYVTMFPENDLDPYISVDVQEISSSSSSASLRGSPKGYRDSSLIAGQTDLTFTILFRNLGTDTINRVVIRDTLAPGLDITTVVPGASNFPYEFEIYDNGILKLTFNDVRLLPGGGAGDPGSYGFVKFSVSQKPDNPVGTVIENSATIYFDYQKPEQTNRLRYQVGEFPEFIEVISSRNDGYWPGVEIKAYPNPFTESVRIDIEGRLFKEVVLKVFDASGRLVSSSSHYGNQVMYYRQNLPAGLYVYRLESEGQLINSGKLLVR